jgi:hypothetical protein
MEAKGLPVNNRNLLEREIQERVGELKKLDRMLKN